MSTTKKKKSAREKRVLIASLIVAATIIAGSTFAWFTSTDEVTNRLTANADYGVSIVESFTPPENWLPGQEVNKDVYAVNTGNIAAFVKEDVSGVLTINYEQMVETFDPANAADYVELDFNTLRLNETNDGSASREAGAFLAWTSLDKATYGDLTGYINTVRPGDDVIKDFVPPASGDFVFRRSIVVSKDSATGGVTEDYTYVGYHYDASTGKYYKIGIVGDPSYDETGKLTARPNIKYFKNNTEEAKAVSMSYDGSDAAKPRLVVKYALDPSGASAYDTEALAARLEIDKADAQTALTAAQTEYNDLKAEFDGINEIINAKNAMIDAAIVYNQAVTNDNTKQSDLDNKINELQGKRFTLSNLEDVNAITSNDINGLLPSNGEGATAVQKSAQKFNDKLTDLGNCESDLAAAITSLTTPEENVTVEDLESAYTALVTAAHELNLACAELRTKTEQEGGPALAYDTGGAVKRALDDYETTVANYDNQIAALKNAFIAYQNAKTVSDDAKVSDAVVNAYNDAVTDYNDVVGKGEYSGAPYSDYILSTTPIEVPTTGDATNANAAAAAIAAITKGNLLDATTYKGSDGTGDTLEQLANKLAEAQFNYDSVAVKTPETMSPGDLIIYINLDKEFADNWTMDPAKTSLTETTPSDVVSFYYNKILAPGETSEKLIDSLELSDKTENKFKDFTFDLNVKLDSIQVSYDTDSRKFTGDSVENPGATASAAWGKNAEVQNDNVTVNWTDKGN